MATRFQADRDLMVVSSALGSKLDPTTDNGIGAKMGLDATAPVTALQLAFKRIRIKGEEDVARHRVAGRPQRRGRAAACGGSDMSRLARPSDLRRFASLEYEAGAAYRAAPTKQPFCSAMLGGRN